MWINLSRDNIISSIQTDTILTQHPDKQNDTFMVIVVNETEIKILPIAGLMEMKTISFEELQDGSWYINK